MKVVFNADYSNLWKEIPLFILCYFLRKDKVSKNSKNILIVNTCIIGEFAASIPAIVDFVDRNKDKTVDLLVSPPLKKIAESIIGIRNVYTAQSVYGRKSEEGDVMVYSSETYESVLILRISAQAYSFLKNVGMYRVQTALPHFLVYAFHLGVNLIMRRTPKEWRVVNFEILGGIPRTIPFSEMFVVKKEDTEVVEKFLNTSLLYQTVVIHTGSSWPMMHWEKEKWVELLQKINEFGLFKFIFIGIEKDKEDYEYISSNVGFKTHSLISQTTVFEMMLTLHSANYFIGIDSGPANLAHLVDLRSIVIFGPGPHMYMPNNPQDMVVDKSNGHGLYQRFFLTKNSFISTITADEVFQAFRTLSGKKSSTL